MPALQTPLWLQPEASWHGAPEGVGAGGPGGSGAEPAPGPFADVTPRWRVAFHSLPATPKHCAWYGPASAPCQTRLW